MFMPLGFMVSYYSYDFILTHQHNRHVPTSSLQFSLSSFCCCCCSLGLLFVHFN
jgi:hypothetical protein